MTTELAKKQMCIVMRAGMEIWIDEEKIDSLVTSLEESRFVRVGEQIINAADVAGIFDAATMEERTMRKNGYWKCKGGDYWHSRGEICAHKQKYGTKTNN